MREFWKRMAPYIPLVEVGHVNADVVADLVGKGLVEGPVLVVGAGHGLLVETLRRHGFVAEGVDFLPEAVDGARQRRGIELTLGDAEQLPYPSGAFGTVIVASGVVDFLDDRYVIDRIVREATRVTRPGGRTLVGFWNLEHGAVTFFEALGLMEGNRFRQRDAFALSRKDPGTLFGEIVAKVGAGRAVWLLAKRFLFLPKQEREQGAALATIWKTEPDPEGLLAAVPADVPMYGQREIGELLAPVAPTTCHPYRGCIVAELPKTDEPVEA